MQFNTIIISKFINKNLKNSKMKNSNWILSLFVLLVGNFFVGIHLGINDESVMVKFYILCSAWAIVKELEKLNKNKQIKSDEFAKNFGDWLKYESCCFPEHKDKSIEELLEIYKKSI